jgi:PAS domain S-box-containing protein
VSEPLPVLTALRQVVEHLPAAVYVCEAPGGTIVLYNRRAAELWGRQPALRDPAERFCGSHRLYHRDGRLLPHDETPMAEVLRGGEPRRDEVVIERPDGSFVTARVSVTPLRDAQHRTVGAINVFDDVTDRIRAEAALRLSERRYRAMVDDHPDLVCRFLADGTLTFVNAAYSRFFGFRREDMLGRSYVPILHPDDAERVGALVAASSPANPVVSIENRVVRADGAVRWTEWTNRALYDDENRLLEFQATGRDVTERKQNDEAAARLAALVASADDAIVSKTLDGVIVSWNRAAERMFGYSGAEALGRPITLITPADRLEEERAILDRVRRGETVVSMETERLRQDGRLVPISLTVSPITDPGGRLIGASSIARDITERRRGEAELKRHLHTLEALYRLAAAVGRARGVDEVCESAVNAVTAVGADRASVLVLDGGVMRFRAWRGLSPRYRAAVDGHSPWTPDAREPAPILVGDALVDPGLEPLRDLLAAEGIRALGFVPIVHQGRLLGKFMVYYDAPHAFTDEELRVAATIAHHVGFGLARAQSDGHIAALLERERAARQEADAARAQAEAANRAKDEFLAMLAHELRNPLSVMVNALAALDRAAPAPEAERARAVMRRQHEHLARLLDELLDVARITSGRIELEREPVDLRSVVELAADALRLRVQAKRQELRLRLGPRPVTVLGDALRLQQVVGNLLDNASKYTAAGGSIAVTLEVGGDEARLRVRDSGAGIAPQHLESIFELFTQANPNLARTEGGLGVGLTVVKRVVELHGGSIRAHSDGPGRGSEFVVRLPVTADAPRPPAEAAEAPPGPGRRILVIEDHEDGRDMLVLTLRSAGHDVLEAATGHDGVELAVAHAPDVALVDIGLPDLDGYEVGRRIREKLGSRLSLIALTGYGQPSDRARSQRAGFDAHLVKPVAASALAQALARLP